MSQESESKSTKEEVTLQYSLNSLYGAFNQAKELKEAATIMLAKFKREPMDEKKPLQSLENLSNTTYPEQIEDRCYLIKTTIADVQSIIEIMIKMIG